MILQEQNFIVYILITGFGALHGLVLLPVLLSFIGEDCVSNLAYAIVSYLLITGPCPLRFKHKISVYLSSTTSDFTLKDLDNYESLNAVSANCHLPGQFPYSQNGHKMRNYEI